MSAIQDNNVAIQRILKEYTDRVKESDDKTRKQLEELVSHAITTFRIHLGLDIVIFVIGITLLIFCIQYIFSIPDSNNSSLGIKEVISIGCGIAGLLIIITLLIRNPVRVLRQPISTLTKVNIIFLGYTRQMRQVDVVFKRLMISVGDLGEERINQIQDDIHVAVEEAIEQVNRSLEELI